MTAQEQNNSSQKLRSRLFLLTALLVIFAIALSGLWLLVWRFEEYTDNAYVGGNQIAVNSQVDSSIVALYADDTDLVDEGALIATLDDRDFQLIYEEQKANLALAARNVRELIEDYRAKRALICQRLSEFKNTLTDFRHRERLANTGAISKEDFTHALAAKDIAAAALEVAIQEWKIAYAQLQVEDITKHPLLESAKAFFRQAYENLTSCRVYAPSRGFITKRRAQVGQTIFTNTTLMTIIPLDSIWVDANFKETQLQNMRIGQKVTLRSDIYGNDVAYEGIVLGLSAGTGSVFSILPPQNATGNWIKIIQRLPVRILLNKEQLAQHPLRIGLSMKVTIDTRDRSGPRLSEKAIDTTKPLYSTFVLNSDFTEQDKIIDEVIKANLFPHYPKRPLCQSRLKD